jgi:hypothetical protein
MTALGDMLSPEARERLERARELAALDRLIRQVPEQRPPEPTPTLAQLSAATTTERKSA